MQKINFSDYSSNSLLFYGVYRLIIFNFSLSWKFAAKYGAKYLAKKLCATVRYLAVYIALFTILWGTFLRAHDV